MVELRWIKMFLFLILGLQFTAVTRQESSVTVRNGDDVTLSCRNVINGQEKCDSTTWIYIKIENSPVEELIKLGQIGEKAKSDRLSVTADCSLVIKKVTYEDVGRYTCRQTGRSGQYEDSQTELSVVSIYEQRDADDTVTLSCHVLKYGRCQHTVEWLYEGITDKLKETKRFCLATVTFNTSSVDQKLFKCKVTEHSGETRMFNFTSQSSSKKQGNTTRVENKTSDGPTNPPDCSALIYTMLVMRVVELVLITVVTVLITVVAVRHFRAGAGNQRPPDDHTVSYSVKSRTARRSGPAASQMHHGEDDNVTVNYENLREN